MTDAIQKAREALDEALKQLDISVGIARRDHPEGPVIDGKRLNIDALPHSQDILAGHVKDRIREALAALDAETEVKVRAPVRWPSAGDKMRFRAENGYDFELAAAKEIFQKGDVVTVRKCDVGRFSHTIWFEGHEQGFNGVMFELLPPESRS